MNKFKKREGAINKMGLYKGVFWIVYNNRERYIFRIPCDINGNIIGQADYPLNSKDGSNYNHKNLWAVLNKSITGNKPFDYYPRGRVEIRNGRATVYLNPDINNSEIQSFITEQFGLKAENGIVVLRFVSDGSNHYLYKQ